MYQIYIDEMGRGHKKIAQLVLHASPIGQFILVISRVAVEINLDADKKVRGGNNIVSMGHLPY